MDPLIVSSPNLERRAVPVVPANLSTPPSSGRRWYDIPTPWECCCYNWVTQTAFGVLFIVLIILHTAFINMDMHKKVDLSTFVNLTALKPLVDQQRELQAIHSRIIRRAPDTTSFSLGRNPKTGRFMNVIMDTTSGDLLVRNNDLNPIGLTSEYIELRDHGTVIPDNENNAYRISGMGEVVFKCPPGFTGHECHLTQYCNTVDDIGKYKPVTMQLFNMLNLNINARNRQRMRTAPNNDNNDADEIPQEQPMIVDAAATNTRYTNDGDYVDDARVAELIHPRIRMHCLTTNGGYVLETCPPDKLLDINLNCVPYDMCSDRLSGSRHNQQLEPNDPLGTDEYYICQDNKSVRKRCTKGTVFDSAMGGCVPDSRCYNMGKVTFPINSHSYLQCAYDEGSVVECPQDTSSVHYDTVSKRHSCRMLAGTGTVNCIPRIFEHEIDSTLKYAYGQQICTPEERIVLCDTTPEPERFIFTWAERFEHVFPLWPRQVLDTDGQCTDAPPLSIIHKPVMLRFSKAMYTEHPFDFPTMEYVCDPTRARYRWDYVQNVVYDIQHEERGPLRITNDFLVSTAAPCQLDAQDTTLMPPHYDVSFLHPPVEQRPFIFISIPTYLPTTLRNTVREASGNLPIDTTFWPVYIPNVGYTVSQCIYMSSENEMHPLDPNVLLIRTERNTKTPPFGFNSRSVNNDNAQQLELFGYPKATKNGHNHHYYIATGRIEGAQIAQTADDYALLDEQRIPIESSVTTTNQDEATVRYFTFNWSRIIDTVDVLPGLQITPTSIIIHGTTYIRGFLVLSLTPRVGSNSELMVLDIGGLDDIVFVAKDYPELYF